ncbi:PIN domain-containing protein [Micromonospora viridifaciens]|uniref:PIN domain-containing protein n=1 Tax=Micromonospora viridifaciens TaxID=1881 RepID=A0A1C4YE26_MICVI|nr:PIN domain-containing protein [Micromonospora viridifaciens]SCF18975.1 PIN domain-containing protein [Micromonospora viridifaciens]
MTTLQDLAPETTASIRPKASGTSSPWRRQSGLTVVSSHPQLIAVLDTNALANACCLQAATGHDSLITRLVATERVPCFIADHVPGEMDEHLERISRSQRIDPAEAFRVWRTDVAPLLRVVELPIGEYLRPEIAAIRQPPPGGDPDDWPTLALAAFLGPAFTVTSDSVFAALGFANAGYWAEGAKVLHTAGNLEGRYIDRLHSTLFAARLMWGGVSAVVHLSRRLPWLVPGLGLATGWLASTMWAKRDSVRAAGAALWEAMEPVVARIGAELVQYGELRSSMVIVQDPRWRRETLTERCARYLARSGDPMTPSELRDALGQRSDQRTTAAAIRRAISRHPSFLRSAGERYSIGAPATG